MPSTKKPSSFAKLKGIAGPLSDQELGSDSKQAHLEEIATSSRKLPGALLVPVSLVTVNPFQVRQSFDAETLTELAEDIKERGILQPLVVRLNRDKLYEIVAGERRYRAALLAELTEVPVVVKEMDDRQAELATLVENIQRQELDPKDEQRFYRKLESEYNLTIKEIAQLVHKSWGYVRNRLEGELKSLQPSTLAMKSVSEVTIPTIDGEIINNVSYEDILLETSQTSVREASLERGKPVVRFTPKAFEKIQQTLDSALLWVDQKPDQKTKQHIRERVEEMEQKLMELKRKLTE